MDPNQEIEDLEVLSDDSQSDDSDSVDDFIRQLEEREKDLHITVDTTIIEIAESFDDGEFLTQEFGSATAAPQRVVVAVPQAERASELKAEIERLNAAIAKMEEERGEIFKNSQRRAKDFASYKARVERERTETFQNQVGNLATFLLPALDNFSRAIDSAEKLNDQESVEFQHFFEGVNLVNQQMYEILAKMGIKVIPTVGNAFDPNFHEAVAIEESNDLPDNHICEEMVRGFSIGDRVIRHSMVKVVKNISVSEAVEVEAVETPETDQDHPPESAMDSE